VKWRERRGKVILLEDCLIHDLRDKRVEVGCLNRGGLFEEGLGLHVALRKERRSLSGVLLDNVARDSAALVENESIVILQFQ